MTNRENLIVEVPLPKKGKSVLFFNDRVEFGKQSIRYDDIATLTETVQATVHTYIAIPLGRTFQGSILFKMNNAKKQNIMIFGMSIFGIPIGASPKKVETFYPPLFDAVYSIVASHMAQKHIERIRGGASVEVAGLTINSASATSKAKKEKNVAVITKEKYRDSQLTNNHGVDVFDKQGEKLWNSSIWSNEDALLIPYILDALFGSP